MDHQGVYYNLDGRPALDGYVEKLEERDVPSAFLSPVADIDEKTDLAHAISCMRAIKAGRRVPDRPVRAAARDGLGRLTWASR